MARTPRKPKKTNDAALTKTASVIDDLAEFEQFRREFWGQLQKDLLAGLSAADLRKKYHAKAQARLIMNAIADPDSARSTAAARDLIDRTEGRAIERREETRKYENTKEEQLRAALLSKVTRLVNRESEGSDT